MALHTIGIVGTGTMGRGIAQVSAQAGYEVVFQNRRQASVDRAMLQIQKSLERLASKGKIADAEASEALGRIRGSCPWRSSRAAST